MKMSCLNIKKINMKNVDKSYSGQDMLFKMGELYQYESGIYGYGNLWTKIQRNVEEIIIDELDKEGCIQVQFPILQPKQIWEKSNRWHTYTEEQDIMFTIENNLGQYGLAPTAEECAALFGAERLTSVKNLPATYYQLGEKFRKEIRTRGYLFRPRTFTMMDAYSFSKNEEEMVDVYDKMHQVYLNIFNRLGIKIVPTLSDNGTMGGKVAEEWMVFTEYGEDCVLYDEKNNIGLNEEILERADSDIYLKEKYGIEDITNLKRYHALELGNNFQLGTKYSHSMKLYFTDGSSNLNPYYMGCYGIGVGRIIATIIENNILKKPDGTIKGLSLPKEIAPYKVQIVYKDNKEDIANKLYNYFQRYNIKSIIDDRKGYSLGNKIKDSYVLGTPYIAIIGDNSSHNIIELEETKSGEKTQIDIENMKDIINHIS